MEWSGRALPHRRVMLGWGECQTEHRLVQQINRDQVGISRTPLCACFALRADGCIQAMSSASYHAGSPHIASVLVQNHRNDPSARVAFEVELRVGTTA